MNPPTCPSLRSRPNCKGNAGVFSSSLYMYTCSTKTSNYATVPSQRLNARYTARYVYVRWEVTTDMLSRREGTGESVCVCVYSFITRHATTHTHTHGECDSPLPLWRCLSLSTPRLALSVHFSLLSNRRSPCRTRLFLFLHLTRDALREPVIRACPRTAPLSITSPPRALPAQLIRVAPLFVTRKSRRMRGPRTGPRVLEA